MILDLRPNLIIAGAQKAGTTTLATRLAAHPEIYLPPEKELNFFTKSNWYLQIDSYLQRFSPGEKSTYRMDATPGYLWTKRKDSQFVLPGQVFSPPIPESIRSFLGRDTKILIILRHPTFRAVSAFFHHFRMGRVNTNDRIRNLSKNFGIIDIGFYSDHIENYFKTFTSKNIKIYFLEEYSKDKARYDKEIFTWLNLDPNQVEHSTSKEDSNANFQIEFYGDVLRLRDGLEQVLHLKESDPRFKKRLMFPRQLLKRKIFYF